MFSLAFEHLESVREKDGVISTAFLREDGLLGLL